MPHHFTRKRWRELQDAIRAEEDARQKAVTVSPKAKKKVVKAADKAAEAIEAAKKTEAESVSRELQRMTDALEAVASAKKTAAVIARSDEVVRLARAVMQALEDEDEEEAVSLLLTV